MHALSYINERNAAVSFSAWYVEFVRNVCILNIKLGETVSIEDAASIYRAGGTAAHSAKLYVGARQNAQS
jgi:hypothetical protein